MCFCVTMWRGGSMIRRTPFCLRKLEPCRPPQGRQKDYPAFRSFRNFVPKRTCFLDMELLIRFQMFQPFSVRKFNVLIIRQVWVKLEKVLTNDFPNF
ncbi:hypothetical protein CDAR_100991 [Caerostris darwini]|uniref:Uncharacterized protein n=1 Tax=Caerostris darwini TaxID=1538125 RepID=A0AAV4W9G7_9ARAC|nr:hypothetical protein CDAR_100991 [Caerostris darwini]